MYDFNFKECRSPRIQGFRIGHISLKDTLIDNSLIGILKQNMSTEPIPKINVIIDSDKIMSTPFSYGECSRH